MAFDKDFAWGVACSAYQTEGAENEDGRGESIWDSKFTKGKTLGDMNGKIACDHYHRMEEDVDSSVVSLSELLETFLTAVFDKYPIVD